MARSLDIYFLDADPARAAEALCDRHVVRAPEVAAMVLRDAAAMRRAVHEGRSLRRGEAQHPRHPVTRKAARSAGYALWVCSYGVAAALERAWRGLCDADSPVDVLAAARELDGLAPVDPVRRTPVLVDDYGPRDWLTAVPQRFGDDSYVVPGDPVGAYRRWYAEVKCAPRWAGDPGAAWARREPPAWLAVHGVSVERIDLPGDAWPTWGAFRG